MQLYPVRGADYQVTPSTGVSCTGGHAGPFMTPGPVALHTGICFWLPCHLRACLWGPASSLPVASPVGGWDVVSLPGGGSSYEGTGLETKRVVPARAGVLPAATEVAGTWCWAPGGLAIGAAVGSQQCVFRDETLQSGPPPPAFSLFLNRPGFAGPP